MVSIDDAQENTWVDAMADGYSSSQWWLGINDLTVEDYWDWDGPYTSFTKWGVGEPNGSTDENCGVLNQTSGDAWSDVGCSLSIYFVCEANP